jgi:hypothetical protein
MKAKHPLLFLILDGFGQAPDGPYNAVSQAAPRYYYSLREQWPSMLLEASSEHVGLPSGQMGNSEVGHLTLGSGRIIWQELVRIDRAIQSGSLREAPRFKQMAERALQGDKRIHLIGLVSRWRRPLEPRASSGDDPLLRRDGGWRSSRAARAARWPRHCAALCRGLRRGHGARARARRRAHGHDRRPLLHDGPRQALGARQEGVGFDRAGAAGRWGGSTSRILSLRSRRRTRGTKATNSCCRARSRAALPWKTETRSSSSTSARTACGS